MPECKRQRDWDLIIAGKRVQVIKDTEEYGKGFIQFGTEVVHSEENEMGYFNITAMGKSAKGIYIGFFILMQRILIGDGSVSGLVVRENSEGEYSSVGGRMYQGENEIAIQNNVFSRRATKQAMEHAFALAKSRDRHVTSATKSNGIFHSMPFWDEVFKETATHAARYNANRSMDQRRTLIGQLWTAKMLLDHHGEEEMGTLLLDTMERVTADGFLTPDVGGKNILLLLHILNASPEEEGVYIFRNVIPLSFALASGGWKRQHDGCWKRYSAGAVPGILVLIAIALIGMIMEEYIPANIPAVGYIALIGILVSVPWFPGSVIEVHVTAHRLVSSMKFSYIQPVL